MNDLHRRIKQLKAELLREQDEAARYKVAALRREVRIVELEAELSAAHESAQGCAEELARVADELRVMKRRCSVPHTWELTTDGKRCLVCGRRENFIAGNTHGEVDL